VRTSIVELPTHLRVELYRGAATEMMQTYRDAAVRCLQKGITRALVVAMNGDPDVHESLRSTLRAMAMAGCAAGFRFALVAERADTAAVYEAAFATEAEALRWLNA
jgi:hypothetical protein